MNRRDELRCKTLRPSARSPQLHRLRHQADSPWLVAVACGRPLAGASCSSARVCDPLRRAQFWLPKYRAPSKCHAQSKQSTCTTIVTVDRRRRRRRVVISVSNANGISVFSPHTSHSNTELSPSTLPPLRKTGAHACGPVAPTGRARRGPVSSDRPKGERSGSLYTGGRVRQDPQRRLTADEALCAQRTGRRAVRQHGSLLLSQHKPPLQSAAVPPRGQSVTGSSATSRRAQSVRLGLDTVQHPIASGGTTARGGVRLFMPR